MNGFQREVRDRMLSVIPHIEVLSANGAMNNVEPVIAQVRQNPKVTGAAPFVAGQAMVSREDVLRGVVVRGIDPSQENAVSDLAKQIRKGTLASLVAGEYGVVIGRDLARGLGTQVGDKITLIAPQGTTTPAGFVPRLKAFTVVAIFDSGHFEYDSGLVVMQITDAAKFFRVDGVSGVRVRTKDMNEAPSVAAQLMQTLPPDTFARDWSRENKAWFAAVQVEKRMMFIILTLIIAVAAFNLVSMLVMTVTEKRPDIAILRTIGVKPSSIRWIFMVQGALIGWLGTLVGIVLGIIIALNIGGFVHWVEGVFNFQVLPEGIYLITRLPSQLNWQDVATIGITSFVLSLLATIYPSQRASKVQPAEALRYE